MKSIPPLPVNAAVFPIGSYTYTVNGVTPLVKFDEQGSANASLDGEIIVSATNKVTGDLVEIVDSEGTYAYPEGWVGKYNWTLNGEILSYVLIDDQNPGRRKAFAQPFIRQK
jgi:hypothetical protein